MVNVGSIFPFKDSSTHIFQSLKAGAVYFAIKSFCLSISEYPSKRKTLLSFTAVL